MRHDVAGAREQLRRLLDTIRLQPKDGALVAVVQGDLAGILPVGNLDAGGPVAELYSWPLVRVTVA